MFNDMKGSQQILDKLEQGTQEKIAKIYENGSKKAEEIKEKAEREINAVRAQHSAELKTREAEMARRAAGAAELAGKKQILAAKQSIIEAAYIKAQESLLALDTDEYCKILCKFATEAAQNNGAGELIFNARDRAQIGEKVLREAAEKSGMQLVLSERTADILGGFILRLEKAEINCAIETLVKEQALINSRRTASILFGAQ